MARPVIINVLEGPSPKVMEEPELPVAEPTFHATISTSGLPSTHRVVEQGLLRRDDRLEGKLVSLDSWENGWFVTLER